VAQAHNAMSYYLFAYFFIFMPTLTADISYYITTEFSYAKRNLLPVAFGGVVLKRFEFIKVCMGENGNQHFS